jgi:hypothetical protein
MTATIFSLVQRSMLANRDGSIYDGVETKRLRLNLVIATFARRFLETYSQHGSRTAFFARLQ